MKFRITEKHISSFFVDIKNWDDKYDKIKFDFKYKVIPSYYNEELIGYHIKPIDNDSKLTVYQIWYFDEFNSKMQGWKQCKWSEYHDRDFDDCLLSLEEAEKYCYDFKNKYENMYGKIVKEFDIINI